MAVLQTYTTFRFYFGDTVAAKDPDGYEPFLVANIRASGFTGGFSGIPAPNQAVSFPWTVSVDGQASGAETYDVFLSQRTDDATKQMFSVVLVTGKSGTWTIALTTQGIADIGLSLATDTLTLDQATIALKHAHLYCRRRSDSAIQWADLLAKVTANA